MPQETIQVPKHYNSYAPASCICRTETGDAPGPTETDETILSVYQTHLSPLFPFRSCATGNIAGGAAELAAVSLLGHQDGHDTHQHAVDAGADVSADGVSLGPCPDEGGEVAGHPAGDHHHGRVVSLPLLDALADEQPAPHGTEYGRRPGG